MSVHQSGLERSISGSAYLHLLYVCFESFHCVSRQFHVREHTFQLASELVATLGLDTHKFTHHQEYIIDMYVISIGLSLRSSNFNEVMAMPLLK